MTAKTVDPPRWVVAVVAITAIEMLVVTVLVHAEWTVVAVVGTLAVVSAFLAGVLLTIRALGQ